MSEWLKRRWVWVGFVVLFLLHQDVWLWGNGAAVLGFMPAGLAYHAAFSIAAAALWWAAVKFAWPKEIEAWAEASAVENADNQNDGPSDLSRMAERSNGVDP